jgi:uncharacterized protein YjiS (DUF1127 family)
MAYSLSGERPVIAAWPTTVLLALLRRLAAFGKARRRRIALGTLLDMDDYRLWDLGISRDDLARAVRSDQFDIDAVRDSRRWLDIHPPR